MKQPCNLCNAVHPSNAARVYGIFTPPKFYRAITAGAPRRTNRASAEADYCAALQQSSLTTSGHRA
ncbi:hypothetical protein [Jonesia denitrificans]|uniref:Uncharacterized protein n=1 Tax=Jonesia denitrificans (strain ATCC 14870 / DSM 20603 / BCRC 15368 / CIP 55.134 / JCM 11481 / NBRC 15587 / NCTC 10816 / Prevot 55134) TaxID=471856 RepID=C7R1V4_JONDD|nr:hypothetical protein [Jonesia denitrificans]ACV08422.1 hypothetical protein Jden_0759 [Jonesia denitrificans DSM 20603]QXB42539.1 hypothetical protein I6L70_08225 [Jonesia denitrificans]SQH20401.1 Uncharacterised protein [Jonesia denitrificans]